MIYELTKKKTLPRIFLHINYLLNSDKLITRVRRTRLYVFSNFQNLIKQRRIRELYDFPLKVTFKIFFSILPPPHARATHSIQFTVKLIRPHLSASESIFFFFLIDFNFLFRAPHKNPRDK